MAYITSYPEPILLGAEYFVPMKLFSFRRLEFYNIDVNVHQYTEYSETWDACPKKLPFNEEYESTSRCSCFEHRWGTWRHLPKSRILLNLFSNWHWNSFFFVRQNMISEDAIVSLDMLKAIEWEGLWGCRHNATNISKCILYSSKFSSCLYSVFDSFSIMT